MGLEYKRNRYYDPQSGHFTQGDPIGVAGGLNAYGFGSGDPINLSDPFGLCTGTGDDACKADDPLEPSLKTALREVGGDRLTVSDRFCGGIRCDWVKGAMSYAREQIPGLLVAAVSEGRGFWSGLKPAFSKTRTNGLSGSDRRYYAPVRTHGDLEVYDRLGRLLGSADASTGEMTKAPVAGRKIDVP